MSKGKNVTQKDEVKIREKKCRPLVMVSMIVTRKPKECPFFLQAVYVTQALLCN